MSLASPWTSDGYLSGYLAVKEFSYAAEFMASRYFADKDFVLNYILHYFFHDVDLLKILLRPFDDMNALEELIAHAVKRVRNLMRDGSNLLAASESLEHRLLARRR